MRFEMLNVLFAMQHNIR